MFMRDTGRLSTFCSRTLASSVLPGLRLAHVHWPCGANVAAIVGCSTRRHSRPLLCARPHRTGHGKHMTWGGAHHSSRHACSTNATRCTNACLHAHGVAGTPAGGGGRTRRWVADRRTLRRAPCYRGEFVLAPWERGDAGGSPSRRQGRCADAPTALPSVHPPVPPRPHHERKEEAKARRTEGRKAKRRK
jgi:hypothetical protein